MKTEKSRGDAFHLGDSKTLRLIELKEPWVVVFPDAKEPSVERVACMAYVERSNGERAVEPVLGGLNGVDPLSNNFRWDVAPTACCALVDFEAQREQLLEDARRVGAEIDEEQRDYLEQVREREARESELQELMNALPSMVSVRADVFPRIEDARWVLDPDVAPDSWAYTAACPVEACSRRGANVLLVGQPPETGQPDEDGQLVRCLAGCPTRDVTAALGLSRLHLREWKLNKTELAELVHMLEGK